MIPLRAVDHDKDVVIHSTHSTNYYRFRKNAFYRVMIYMSKQEPLISDYALIGNCRAAALVSNKGAIDQVVISDG